MTELHWLSAQQIAAAYAARSLSPVELVTALLARISAMDARLNAFIRLDAEAALDAAHLAERALASGCAQSSLCGVPVAVKDIIDVAGQPTTCHSKMMLEHVAAQDAAVIARLRAAGAIILGKLALHEFAIGGPSFDLPFPPARNPWNPAYHPGGSSSGCGVALAAGFVPLAIGTDTGGSVRNPAGACGVSGLKPTYGAVSRRGVFPLAFTLDHVGPMARSVGDIALLFDAIAGHDPLDPASVPGPVPSAGAELARGVRGLRIGYVRAFHECDVVADPEVVAALDQVANVLTQEGADVRTVALPPLQDFYGAQRVIMAAESWAVHARWLRERPADYCLSSRRRLMAGAFLSAGDYIEAQQRRRELIDAVGRAFDGVDVLIVANAMDPPCRIDDEETMARTYVRQARNVFSLTGNPALALMCGLSSKGLPLSVQIAGRAHGEAMLLRVGAAYERATQWHTRHPPLLSGASGNFA